MRNLVLTVSLFIALVTHAEQTNLIITFTNLNGKVFRDVEVVSLDHRGLVWKPANGVGAGRVPTDELSSSVKNLFLTPDRSMQIDEFERALKTFSVGTNREPGVVGNIVAALNKLRDTHDAIALDSCRGEEARLGLLLREGTLSRETHSNKLALVRMRYEWTTNAHASATAHRVQVLAYDAINLIIAEKQKSIQRLRRIQPDIAPEKRREFDSQLREYEISLAANVREQEALAKQLGLK